jgi:2-dehydropantoate 2-reductase
MGSLIAARLALTGTELVLLGRASDHLRQIERAGLELIELDGSRQQIPLTATADPAAVNGAELLIVLVKSWTTTEAVTPLREHIDPTTTVLTLQNGLGNVAQIRAALGDDAPNEILIGVTAEAALREAPGRVRHTGAGSAAIGRPDGAVTPRLAAAAAMFANAGLPTVAVPDIERWVWRKLAVNAAINGPTALAQVPNGAVISDGGLRSAAVILAAEVATVARARGLKLDHVRAAVDEVARETAANRSSMLQDLEAGRRTEVESIYGVMIAEAERLGVGVPASRVVAALIRARERAARAERGGSGAS